MKKFLTTWVAVLCCSMALWAQPITEQQAMDRALQYLNSGKASAKARRMAAASKAGKLKAAPVEADRIYAFNREGGGYVIASADQRTLPVLGYSTTGSIDWDNMPDNMRSWLKQYDKAIATLGHRTDFCDGEQTVTPLDGQGTMARQLRRAERTAVEPLIKTHWNQNEPYWNLVPTYQGPILSQRNKQCLVGCGATSMAQMMNYWQWPKSLPDGLPAYDIEYYGINGTWHIDALPPTLFDWDNMQDDYSYKDPETGTNIRLETTEVQDKAVATLMRYCGQAIQMRYGTDALGGSSASPSDIARALVNYFDYKAAQTVLRFPYSIDEWEGLIYGELAAGRPIIYNGQTESSGHSFVCDGYDGQGLFHINWGWSGKGDGYFSLSVLNPYNNTSAGSGSSGIGYCIDSNAIIYTDPHMDPLPPREFDSKFYQFQSLTLDGDNVVVLYCALLFGVDDEVADHALGTIDDDGQLHPLFMGDPNDSIVSPFDLSHFYIEIDSTAFTAGQTLTLYPMVRLRHPSEEWQVIPPLEQNLTAGRDEDGHFFARINQKAYDLQLTDVAITRGTGRVAERCDLTIRVRNNDASDYSRNLYLTPIYYGHIKPEEMNSAPVLARGSKMQCGAYIPAGGEADVTFGFVPEYGGTIVFSASVGSQIIGQQQLELNNDTLANYDFYLVNKSYLSRDGDQWYWNVVLADRVGMKMPHWIPSDSLWVIARQYLNNERVKASSGKKGIKEYLAALPDSIGTGNYTFTQKMPVEVSQPGDYYFDSYLGEVANKKLLSNCCLGMYRFTVDDETGIRPIDNGQWKIENERVISEKGTPWYDLSGRRIVNGILPKGLYIRNGRKMVIK